MLNTVRLKKKTVPKSKIKPFDFKRKPNRPTALMHVAKGIISFPDLKKRGAVIEKIDMEGIEGKPYILLINHASLVDLNLMLKATHPYPVNNVMTLEGYETYTAPIMRMLGVLAKRKFVQDLNLIRNIRYCLNELKTVFAIFPEARYTLDGKGSYIPESLGGLVKMMKVPTVMLEIKGNFVTCPQWNKINKGIYVEAKMYPLVKEDEIRTLTADEIFARIKKAFTYDDFKWQKEKGIVIDHPERAKGLHSLLYKCPNCGAEHETDSAGTELWCNACKKRWTMDEYGQLHANEGETEYPHIPDWSDWERACVREEIRNGTYRFEDEIRLETLPKGNCFYAQGTAKLIQTPEGTTIEGTCYGEPFTLHKKPLEQESVHIEYDYLGRGDCVEISVTDDSYWCYLTKRDAITKLSFATEEIFFLAKENAPQKTPRARRVRSPKDETTQNESAEKEPVKAES